MRTGTYDCLKLEKDLISGQKYAEYQGFEKANGFSYISSTLTMTDEPKLPYCWDYDRSIRDTSRWFTEIKHTAIDLNPDEKSTPRSFSI